MMQGVNPKLIAVTAHVAGIGQGYLSSSTAFPSASSFPHLASAAVESVFCLRITNDPTEAGEGERVERNRADQRMWAWADLVMRSFTLGK